MEITRNTASTTSPGALQVTGGVIGGSVYAGGTLNGATGSTAGN